MVENGKKYWFGKQRVVTLVVKPRRAWVKVIQGPQVGSKFNVSLADLKDRPPIIPVAQGPPPGTCPRCGACNYVSGVQCGCGYNSMDAFREWYRS